MLEIRVTAVPPGQADGLSAAAQVDMWMAALGFKRSGAAPVAVSPLAPAASITSIDGEPEADDEQGLDEGTKPVVAAAPAEAPRRRGRPRKEEIPASQPQPQLQTAAPTADAPAEPVKAEAPIPAQPVEEQPQIRTNPEDRAEQPPPAVVEAKKLTHEDLRDALGRLSKVIGLATAVAEVRSLVGGGIQDVPDTQEAIGAVLAKLEARIAGGPPLAGDAPAATPKTHDDVKAAIVAYAKRYGQDAAKVDWKVITGHQKVDDMPADAVVLGKAVAEILAAVEANPFGRARVDG